MELKLKLDGEEGRELGCPTFISIKILTGVNQRGDGRSTVAEDARYLLLCCGFPPSHSDTVLLKKKWSSKQPKKNSLTFSVHFF
jgi:hypothetical protein